MPLTHLTPLYATETGTAARFSHDLAHRARHLLPNTSPATEWTDPNLLVSKTITDHVLVFVVATTGDGDMPHSSLHAWRTLLNKALLPDTLSHVNFAIFGLGDSSYEKFNAAARKLSARLVQLGAKPVCDAGAGDDLHAPFVVFDKWMRTKLFPALAPTREPYPPTLPPPPRTILIPAQTRPHTLRVATTSRLTPSDWFQDTRHVEFHVSTTEMLHAWKPGDALRIFPRNPRDQIQQLIKRLSVPANLIAPSSPLWTLLEEHLDILTIPSRMFFEVCSFFCTDAGEKEKMLELAGYANNNNSDPKEQDVAAESYYLYCVQERRTHLEGLMDFASCHIPWDRFIELIPPLRSRAYSISSSHACHDRIHLTVAVATYLTPWKRLKTGLCSSYLASLVVGDEVRIDELETTGPLSMAWSVLVGQERDDDSLTILIATGTGIAPMRSFICSDRTNNNRNRTKIRLYLGCRCRGKDDYYRDEMLKMAEVKFAYSRPSQPMLTNDSGKDIVEVKGYVHTLLARDGKELWEECFVKKTGCVMICGASKRMPLDVKETFIQMAEKIGGLDRDEATKRIKGMEKEGRWVVEGF